MFNINKYLIIGTIVIIVLCVAYIFKNRQDYKTGNELRSAVRKGFEANGYSSKGNMLIYPGERHPDRNQSLDEAVSDLIRTVPDAINSTLRDLDEKRRAN